MATLFLNISFGEVFQHLQTSTIDEWRIEDYLLLGVFHQFFRGKCSCRIARFQGRCAVTRRMMLLTMAKCGKLGAEILTGMSLAYEIRYMRLKKSGG